MFTIHVAWKFSEFLITHLKMMVKPLSIIGLVTGLNTEYWLSICSCPYGSCALISLFFAPYPSEFSRYFQAF